MTCLLVEVEQYNMQRSTDRKEKKGAVIEPHYLKPYWKQQKMLESYTVKRTVSAPKNPC